MKTFIKDSDQYLDQEITLQGFVDQIRNLQYVQFLILNDGTSKIQITIEKESQKEELISLVDQLTLQSTIKVKGIIQKNEKVKLGQKEMIPSSITVTSFSANELPIDLKNKDNTARETRLDYRFLDLRREENHLFFKIQTIFEHALREYCLKNHFIEIHTPKIAFKAAESGAETFKIDYFGKEACLSQSPQFYKQMAIASNFNQVFEIGPAFRAENSHTSYHATEIEMADVEIGFIDSVEDVMQMEEAWLKYAFQQIEPYQEQIEQIFHVKLSDMKAPFARISFLEAKQILKDQFSYQGEKEDDLDRQEEKYLSEYAKKKYQTDFLFVTDYPFSARPFYHMKKKDVTCSYDLIYKGVEITTGSQREHRYDILKKQMEEKNINPEDLNFYLDFFGYGCPPHGGFAIGIARVMMQLFEMDNIREATLIYRGPTRLYP